MLSLILVILLNLGDVILTRRTLVPLARVGDLKAFVRVAPRFLVGHGIFSVVASRILERSRPFALARYADGEYLIMEGIAVGGADGWRFRGGRTRLGTELIQSLANASCSDYFYCMATYPELGRRFVDPIDRRGCYSDVFVNDNWPLTRLLFQEIVRQENGTIILFCSEKVTTTWFAAEVVRFPSNVITWYEANGDTALDRFRAMARQYQNRLFVFSTGPLSEVLIWHMWQANPNNRYVDFGSSLDYDLQGRISRPYQRDHPDELRRGRILPP